MLELTIEEQAIYTKLVNQIQQAMHDGDEVKFNKSKAELGERLKNNKLSDLVRII